MSCTHLDMIPLDVWPGTPDRVCRLPRAGMLVLRIRDEPELVVVEAAGSGPGIPDDGRGHVFDAFFTAQPAGLGSGLRLDNARRIVVQRHHGSIELATSPPGTSFGVRLPEAHR